VSSSLLQENLANSQPEEHLQWVRQWMTEMLEEDTEYVSLIKTILEASLIIFLIDPRYTSLCHWELRYKRCATWDGRSKWNTWSYQDELQRSGR
jgi:hypothetical protein